MIRLHMKVPLPKYLYIVIHVNLCLLKLQITIFVVRDVLSVQLLQIHNNKPTPLINLSKNQKIYTEINIHMIIYSILVLNTRYLYTVRNVNNSFSNYLVSIFMDKDVIYVDSRLNIQYTNFYNLSIRMFKLKKHLKIVLIPSLDTF